MSEVESAEGLRLDIRLKAIGDTPQHKALQGAFLNSLVDQLLNVNS